MVETGQMGLTAEELARGILQRQLDAGEARVPWEERGASREARVKLAAQIIGWWWIDGPMSAEDLAEYVAKRPDDDGVARDAVRVARHAHAILAATPPGVPAASVVRAEASSDLERAFQDAQEYGVGYLVDGRRVAPQLVRVIAVAPPRGPLQS